MPQSFQILGASLLAFPAKTRPPSITIPNWRNPTIPILIFSRFGRGSVMTDQRFVSRTGKLGSIPVRHQEKHAILFESKAFSKNSLRPKIFLRDSDAIPGNHVQSPLYSKRKVAHRRGEGVPRALACLRNSTYACQKVRGEQTHVTEREALMGFTIPVGRRCCGYGYRLTLCGVGHLASSAPICGNQGHIY